MKLILLSDTHCRLRKVTVPNGDLLLHAGDLTFQGNVQEISQELRELGRIAKNFKYGCVFICGNHDRLGEHNPALMKQMAIDEGLIYLDHSSAQINGFNIFGSAYTPAFCNWAFNVDRAELKPYWDQIPDNTDILVTHGPPMGILDGVNRFNHQLGEWEVEHTGCADLYNRVLELNQLKLYVCGHIHEGYGSLKRGNVQFVNASICTEEYRPTNEPWVIEL
jgi:Icc-related predicted phosphoesterase